MKVVFFFLMVISWPLQTWACSYAYQYSLFPLGMSGGNLVVLEAEMERYVILPGGEVVFNPMAGTSGNDVQDTDGIDVRWKGKLKVKMLTFGDTTLVKDLGAVDVDDETYEKELQPYFEEGMEAARELFMFEEAEIVRAGVCDYDISCDFFHKKVDAENADVYCYVNEEGYKDKKKSLDFPHKILLKFQNMTKLPFTDLETVEAEVRVDYYKIWKPYGVRCYRIGMQEVMVYTVGWGTKDRSKREKEEAWKIPETSSVEEYVEGKRVLTHGQRFDTVHIL